MNYTYVLDASMSNDALNGYIKAAEAGNTQLRAEIARNDQLIAQAKIRLLNRELAEAERE